MDDEKQPATILIVEDEFITGEDLRSSLVDMGYRAPMVIDNGADAIRISGELHPDIVLMDITLAGEMNGIEAASHIRSEYGIPVIFLTAHSDEHTFQEARITEPFGYIIKPFEPRNLRISIEMARYKYAMDEKLRSSEERYRGFVQNFLGIAYRFTGDFTPVFFHGATEAITGYTESEFRAGTVTWDLLVHPDDAGSVRNNNELIRESNEYSGTREYRILRKDGGVRWIHELIQKISPAGHANAYIQGACYDITNRKNAEESFRVANRKLNLLNNITRHDVLNSLHGLLGLIEMGRDIAHEAELQQLMSDMDVSARQIQKQITFTRNYQDVGVKAPIWQGLSDCIRNAGNSIQHGSVGICVDLSEDIEIYADPLLEKVFYNLIDNALRYGEQLTRISFSADSESAALRVICDDNGVGVPDGEKERIFEQCIGRNTGMGLFLSREILMITGITIREVGVCGEGARFEILVPPGVWRFART